MANRFESTEEFVDHVLERTRDIFLEHYRMAIQAEQEKASPDQSIAREVCVCPVEADPDDIHNHYRFDLILPASTGKACFIDIDYDILVTFAPIEFTRGSLTVHFSPFQWRAVDFEMQGEPRSLEPLQAWMRKWLLDQDPEQIKSSEFVNVIHFVSRIETGDQGRTTFWVDFGTAPKEAFWKLLDILDASGITELSVKSALVFEHWP